jgi:hypothetical protein
MTGRNTGASAPENIDHIFVAFHSPAFPRHDSYNIRTAARPARDAFWNMLIAHKDRVRAVFVAHTHAYSRLRVLDPASADANDTDAFPDEEGGIYQVDVGAAGNGVYTIVVMVQIDGDNVSFRVLEAGGGSDDPFSVIDEWQVESTAETAGSAGR